MNIATFYLTVRQHDALKLPEHSGSMLRGAFGHALRRLACITKLNDCQQCPVRQTCRYVQIFETNRHLGTNVENKNSQTTADNQASHLLSKPTLSNPYILKLPCHDALIKPNSTWHFGITLLGDSIRDYGLIFRAWHQALQVGLHQSKPSSTLSRGSLIKVINHTHTVFDAQSRHQQFLLPDWQIRRVQPFVATQPVRQATLRFLTPFRLQHQGKIIYQPSQFVPARLLHGLYNRIEQCQSQFDPNQRWQTSYASFADFAADIASLTLTPRVQSVKVVRHSSRQQRKIELFGLTGELDISASPAVMERLSPLLSLGQHLHVGKSTTHGLGQYQLQLR